MQISKPHNRKGKNVFSGVTETRYTVDAVDGFIDIEFVTNALSPEGDAKVVAIRLERFEADNIGMDIASLVSLASDKYDGSIEAAKAERKARIDKLEAELIRLRG